MKTGTNFSFEGKSVAIIGGKGKMGTAFAEGLKEVGAEIRTFDRDTQLPEDLETDITLMAISESATLGILDQLSQDTKQKPLITISSTNGLLRKRLLNKPEEIPHITPIHPLSGPKMKGAVMIDCTEPNSLSRKIAEEIAKIFAMEREELPLAEHDKKIALEQAHFHAKIWKWLQSVNNLEAWAKHLPLSQRIGAIGEFRVLMRPDISAELIGTSLPPGSSNQVFGSEFIFTTEDESASIESKITSLTQFLEGLIEEKDPKGLIRSWVKTENERMARAMVIMDDSAGVRSFQEFIRGEIPLENVIFNICLHIRKNTAEGSVFSAIGIAPRWRGGNFLAGRIDLHSKIITLKSDDDSNTVHLTIDANSCVVEDRSNNPLNDKELAVIIRSIARDMREII